MISPSPTLLIIILHDADHLPDLLNAWRRVGVPGATILPSAGGHDTEKSARRGGLSSFLNLFDQGRSPQHGGRHRIGLESRCLCAGLGQGILVQRQLQIFKAVREDADVV